MEYQFTKLYSTYLSQNNVEHDPEALDKYVIWVFKKQREFYMMERGISGYFDPKYNSNVCLEYCRNHHEQFLNWVQENG